MIRVEILQLVSKSILTKQLSVLEDSGWIVTGITHIPVQGELGKIMVTLSDFGSHDVKAETPAKPAAEAPIADAAAPIEQAKATFTVEMSGPVNMGGNGGNSPASIDKPNGKALPPPEVIAAPVVSIS